MAFSKIVLTFTRKILTGENINFTVDNDSLPGSISANESAITSGTRVAGQFLIDPLFDWTLDKYDYGFSWSLDYNLTSLYTVSYSGNTITIEAKNINVTFSAFSSTAGVTAVITNEAAVSPLSITSVGFSARIIKEEK